MVAANLSELYDKALHQSTRVEQTFLELGASLRRLYDRDREQYHKVIERSGIGLRKAYYLVSISHKFAKIPVPRARLREIGWTKLQVIAKHLTPQNYGELLTLAEQNKVRDLEALLRGETPKGDNTHCVLMYFTPKQYEIFKERVLKGGAYRSGRGLLNKEGALIKILREHAAAQA
jgi:hypothetical protein